MKCSALALISAVGLMGILGSMARGDYVLNPGGSVSTTSPDVYNNGVSALAPGAMEISAQNSSLVGNLPSSVSEEVFREVGGTLDFLFQINNAVNDNQPILSANVSHFQGIATSVGYLTTLPVQSTTVLFTQTGSSGPGSANRSASGDSITFLFSTSIGAGTSSNIFFIRTNATAFDFGGSISANATGGSSVLTGSFEPVAGSVVPEPASIVLCGLASVIGLGWAWRRRRPIAA